MSDSLDEIEEAPWLRLGVAAALRRQHQADMKRFLSELASLLERVLPDETRVERRGLLNRSVGAIRLELPQARYVLEADGGRLRAAWTHVVRGIALRTEELSVEAWLAAVDGILTARAGEDEAVREALRRFLDA